MTLAEEFIRDRGTLFCFKVSNCHSYAHNIEVHIYIMVYDTLLSAEGSPIVTLNFRVDLMHFDMIIQNLCVKKRIFCRNV